MAEVNKSVLVPYAAARMYALVDAVEDYPKFLPWCGGTDLLQRDEYLTRATVKIDYHGIQQSFTTENAKQPYHLMELKLVDGPFRQLDGVWRFTDLGGEGCKIELRLQYEFANAFLEALVGPVFSYIANTFVDAFVQRARQVYG